MLWPKPLSTLQNLFCYDSSECSQGNDRVFALRGIATDGKAIYVDYSSDLHTTCLDMALAVAFGRHRRTLNIAPVGLASRKELELFRLLVMATSRQGESPWQCKLWESCSELAEAHLFRVRCS